jgi:hypothetical protein
MLPFGMTIPATVPQRSEMPEELKNYPELLNTQSSFYLEILTISLQSFSLNSADGGIFHKNFGNISFHGTYFAEVLEINSLYSTQFPSQTR